MADKPPPTQQPPATTGKKSNLTASRFKAGMEKAEAGKKALQAKVKDLREGGRFGRAAVDTVEAGLGGAIAGAMDGAGLNIPIGEERHFGWYEVEFDEATGKATGFKDSNGDKAGDFKDALRGVESEPGLSIPGALPAGLVIVAGAAAYEQADMLEIGKGMVAYSTGRMAADAAKAVKALFTAA